MVIIKKKKKPTILTKNPYELIWYNQAWSDNRTKKNNSNYWEWEAKNGNLKW
jgi:hypothetical protein